MVKYLSKFVLEVLPSLVATVVGAYIVAHYINPRAETPKPAVVATAPAGEVKDATEATGTVDGKSADAKSGDTKPADAKAKDEAKAKPAKTESAKTEPAKTEPAKTEPAKTEEKKSATELARAAIERLRGTTVDTPAQQPAAQPVRAPAETARADDSARIAVQAPAQRSPVAAPVPAAVPAPQPAQVAVTTPPPLPPPVIVASPYGRRSVGPESPTPATDRPVDQADADRPTPPADIPGQRDGFEPQAPAAPVEHVSIADHVLSTTKSFFRALTPNSQPSNFSQSNFSQSN